MRSTLHPGNLVGAGLLLLAGLAFGATNDPLAAARRERVKLVEKTFEQLSDRTLSHRARLALDEEKTKWKHGETDHFVYHFQRLTEAREMARQAEFYYARIQTDLDVQTDLAEGKSHIVIFSRPDQWEAFTADAHVPRWTVGFAAGRELFLLVEPGSASVSDRLAHEMTHLVFNRFVPRPVPLWLNEGFAEYESSAAYARFKGIGLAPRHLDATAPMDLARLTSLTRYPEDPEEVARFYRDSERLVRFLISRHPRQDFVPFVNLLADGAGFEQALLKTYAARYRTLEEFKKQFDRF